MSRIETARGWMPRVLFESLMIVFSILLALAVGQWQEARRDRALADQALDSFRQELGANRQRLRQVLPYHERLRDELMRLDRTQAIHSFADMGRIPGFQGFRPAFLLETAWRTAQATGALTHLDYGTVQHLSATYTLQERVDEMNRVTLPTMMSGDALSDAHAATTVRQGAIYLSDIAGLEKEVLGVYDQMLAGLDRPRAPSR